MYIGDREVKKRGDGRAYIGTGLVLKFCLHNTRFLFNFNLKNQCSRSGSGFDPDSMVSLDPDPERQK